MTTIKPRDNPEGVDLNFSDPLHDRIGAQVLRVLGRPPDLIRTQVRPLWGKNYRVNVLVGMDASCVTVGHSFFVQVNEDGWILVSRPEITKLHESRKPGVRDRTPENLSS